MYTVYAASTPNGRMVLTLLEELSAPYEVHKVDLRKGEQNEAPFRALNPNGKVPVLVDATDPEAPALTVFEAGAILIYLAEKEKSALLPAAGDERYAVLEWLMFSMTGVGPTVAQHYHFTGPAASLGLGYAVERFGGEARRIFGVLDVQLGTNEYLAGGEYSLADVATYPWAAWYATHGADLDHLPAVCRWLKTMAARPAVQRGMKAV